MARRRRRPPPGRHGGPGGGGTPPPGAPPERAYRAPGYFLGWLAGATSVYDGRALASQPGTADAYLWAHPGNRRFRYQLFWALYEATVFERLHAWADTLRERHALPPVVDSLYSPANRVGEFWAEHVWAGELDPDAGDGADTPSALPILTDNPAVRPALAALWRPSNWQAKKDTGPLYGAVLGDVFLAVNDDPRRQQVSLEVVHPAYFRDVDEDGAGNVRGYVYEEVVPDPRWFDVRETAPPCTKTVECTRVGASVRYRTFLNWDPYDWRSYREGETEVGPDWTEPYGFVPLVKHQHRDRNLGWGFSELQPTRGRMVHLDGVVSKLCEQLHKAVDAPRLYKGVTGPAELDVEDDDDGDDFGGDRGRDRRGSVYPALYTSNTEASTEELYSLQDLNAGLALANALLEQITAAHPEILADIGDTGTSPSGRAIEKAREKTERRVNSIRAGYDDALVRAQKMALSVGGMRGYPGYEAFPAGSYEAGALDHAIGDRPVFAVDESDRLTEATKRSTVFKTLTDGGMPVLAAMEEAGYPPESLKRAKAQIDEAEAKASARQDALSRHFSEPGAPPGENNPGPGIHGSGI